VLSRAAAGFDRRCEALRAPRGRERLRAPAWTGWFHDLCIG